jgi:hypothetical protein
MILVVISLKRLLRYEKSAAFPELWAAGFGSCMLQFNRPFGGECVQGSFLLNFFLQSKFSLRYQQSPFTIAL